MSIPRTEHVVLHLLPEDKAALQEEAFRRVRVGETRRINASAVLREVLAAWRSGRPAR